MYLHTQVQLTTVHHAVMELREVGRTLAPSALARIVLFFFFKHYRCLTIERFMDATGVSDLECI